MAVNSKSSFWSSNLSISLTGISSFNLRLAFFFKYSREDRKIFRGTQFPQGPVVCNHHEYQMAFRKITGILKWRWQVQTFAGFFILQNETQFVARFCQFDRKQYFFHKIPVFNIALICFLISLWCKFRRSYAYISSPRCLKRTSFKTHMHIRHKHFATTRISNYASLRG